MLRAAYVGLPKPAGGAAPSEEQFWTQVQEQGGWWSAAGGGRASPKYIAAPRPPAVSEEPRFAGDAAGFAFHFLPYASQSFRDGSLAHLPWLQEMPDVVTTAMWSSWVEVNPQAAERLKIQTGDVVEVSSPQGTLRAPAVVMPGIAPDVVAMPIGQGHSNFGRYASGRGANPVSILAGLAEPETGALAWAGTRVALRRVSGAERGQLILFAGGMSRFPQEKEPR
jgi:anaerobic selenocysteine-containing dehydrogenase